VIVWALTVAFVVGAESDALPETGNALARTLAERCGLELRVDPGLSAAAARHGDALLAGLDRTPAQALWSGGLGDPVLWPVVGSGPTRRPLLRAAAERCPDPSFGPTHVGAAWSTRDGRWAAVVLYSRRWIEWAPARWQDTFVVTGTALRPVDAGRVAWLRGCTSELLCDRAEEAPWRPDGSGLRVELNVADVVELLAETDRGPQVVGLWARPGLELRPPSAGDPERAWRTIRRDRGLPTGRPSRALRAAAQQHAEAVCRHGQAVHVDGAGRRPSDRARRAGWTGPVAENVAVARDPARAMANLLSSPSHHRTLVDPKIRAFGFGRASAEGRSCLVQLFGYRAVPQR